MEETIKVNSKLDHSKSEWVKINASGMVLDEKSVRTHAVQIAISEIVPGRSY